MKSIIYNKLGETIHYDRLANGLEVFVLPKKGFHKTVATFTTKYGSVDNSFSVQGKSDFTQVPDGTAHFLEHKMFESEQGDVYHTFAKQGAFVNAFTGFTRTAYTLSATSNINRNLESLLDFVQEPYFTDETVEKEKGIIEQEIRMYEDNPDWRARFGILRNMYKSHPVKIDIAGTIASINQITKEDLYSCYNTFYHPNNMLFFVIGPVIPEKIMNLIQNNQQKKNFWEPENILRIFPDEGAEVNRKSCVMRLPVQTPKVFIGHKERDPGRQGQKLLKYELSLKVLLELMFGSSSEVYEKMYADGYLDKPFTFDYTNENGFGYSLIGGDSREPEIIASFINETIFRLKKEGIQKEDAQRVIKKELGSFLSAINSPQFIANQFTRYRFNEMDLFEVLPTLENLTEEDLTDVLHLHFSDESRTLLIVKEE
ncbi:insulinase family protein [Paenibacillus sp. Lou8.1]|uniref:EF-P 5-aminopentanol modification-associated protein YfmH n=1 Tax=Paenibacillus sp. Lou8.1 TaxID=2962041 RepID=UPI0020B895A8|nr:pitrilysin family protein [Paenibacillus sp. Lou8.1]MCP3810098.1 insulinase family protein [Paenibacillus sp. Lou8.1]